MSNTDDIAVWSAKVDNLRKQLDLLREEKKQALVALTLQKQEETNILYQKNKELKETIKLMQAKILDLEKNLEMATNDNKNAMARAETEKRIAMDVQKKKLENAADEKKKAVKEAEDKKQAIIDELEKKLDNAADEKKKAVKEAEDKKQAKIDELEKKLDNAEINKNKAVKEAENKKQGEIDKLKQDQKFYTDNFTRVEFAQAYAKQVKKLFATVSELENAANILMNSDKLDDPYYLYRAQAKYNQNLDKVDKVAFCSEIDMMARGQVVPNDSKVSKVVNLKGSETNLKKYLFIAYLDKYINAVIVFNESLIGLPYFDQRLSENDIVKFKELQEQLGIDIQALDLECTTLHIKEFKDPSKYHQDIEFNIMDLDSGFKSGEIISIDNCKVSMKDGFSYTDRIRVTIQQ